MRMHMPLFAALLVLTAAADVRADVVGPPPRSCPPGSAGDVCHGGPFCRPATCDGDGDCDVGTTCQDVMGCIGGIGCGGLSTGNDPPIDTYAGPCTNGACTGDATCQATRLCLPVDDPTTGGSTGGGSTGGGSTGGGPTTGTGGGPATSAPTTGATASGPGTGEASGDGTGGAGDKPGCACTTTTPDLAALLVPGLLALARRRRR